MRNDISKTISILILANKKGFSKNQDFLCSSLPKKKQLPCPRSPIYCYQFFRHLYQYSKHGDKVFLENLIVLY